MCDAVDESARCSVASLLHQRARAIDISFCRAVMFLRHHHIHSESPRTALDDNDDNTTAAGPILHRDVRYGGGIVILKREYVRKALL